MKLAEAHPVPAVAAGEVRPVKLAQEVAEDEEEKDEGGGRSAYRHPVAAPRQVATEQQQDDEGGGRYRRDEPGLLHAHALRHPPGLPPQNQEPRTWNLRIARFWVLGSRFCRPRHHLSVSTSSTLAVALLR